MTEPFSTLLKRYMDEDGISINSLSRQININKGTLSSVLKGERKLDEEKLFEFFDKGIFPEGKCKDLNFAYFSEKYGMRTFNHIKYILEKLNELSENKPYILVAGELTEEEKNMAVYAASDHHKVYGCIRCILEESSKNQEDNTVYTNYPLKNTSVNNIVYDFIKNNGDKSDIKHMILLSEKNESTDNLTSLFESIKYAYIRHNVWYKVTESDSCKYENALYPYYFAGKNRVLLMDSEMTSGIMINSSEKTGHILKKIRDIFTDYKPLYLFPENIVEIQNAILFNSRMKTNWTISNHACITRFLDEELCNTVAADDLENRDALIALAVKWYNNVYLSDIINYFSLSAFSELIKNGETYFVPRSMVKDLPMEERKRFLKNFLEYLKSQSCRFSEVFNDSAIHIPEYLHIENYKTVISFFLKLPDRDPCYGNAIAFINVQSIINDFDDFIDYAKKSGMFFSREYVIKYLEDLYLKCDGDDHPILENE